MAWRFEPAEPLRQAFSRVATEEIAKVRAGLTASDVDRDRAIHEARQGFKRLRALARLAKPALGSGFFAESCRWRDAGRLLAGSRDITVMRQSFDKLVAARSDTPPIDVVESLRGRITGSGAETPASDVDANVARVLHLLDVAEKTVAQLTWPDCTDALLKGLRKGQARLRKDWRRARKAPAPEALHRWRKRVKDQSAQLRLFRRVVPDGLRARRNDEKETAELLGEEHDLWLLSERLSADAVPSDMAKFRDRLFEEIEDRRSTLRGAAFEKGAGFSSETPRAFATALCDAWDKASARAAKQRRKRVEAA